MFKKLTNWLKDITGNRDCNTLQSLIEYVPVGNLDRLNYQVQKIQYIPDTKPDDNWEDLDHVMLVKESNCQEKCAIRVEVINTWPGWTARIIHIGFENTDKNHAQCWFTHGELCGFADDAGIKYGYDNEYVQDAIARFHPKATYYLLRDKYGNYLTEMILLR